MPRPVIMTKERKHGVWAWLPTLYIAEALPYVAVNVLTIYFYTRMGVGATEMAFYTGWLSLPWVIKPFWSPFVDIFSTKRRWVLAMQVLMGIGFLGVALSSGTNLYFSLTLCFFWLIAFFSATHDIAADGYYMLELTSHEQAAYVGVRSTFYRIGSLIASGALVWLAGKMEGPGANCSTHSGLVAIRTAWSSVFWILCGFFILIFLYHSRFMPRAKSDVRRNEHDVKYVWKNLGKTFTTFFAKPHVGGAIAFMLLYRLPEAMCIKLVAPFLMAPREAGGLDMATEDIGIANGVTGVIAILLGGILGGLAIARGGLRKWLWPMAASLTLPCVLYCFLAMMQPATDFTGLVWINVAIFVEQFGYGFGFTAFMMYLIYFSEGEWKTSHYAFCTAFMALGMMLPGMAAGWIYDTLEQCDIFGYGPGLGYVRFFWLVMVASVGTVAACSLVKIDPEFGKKRSEI